MLAQRKQKRITKGIKGKTSTQKYQRHLQWLACCHGAQWRKTSMACTQHVTRKTEQLWRARRPANGVA